MGYNYFTISYYKEHVDNIFNLNLLQYKYGLTDDTLRKKSVIAGKKINRYMTVNGSPLQPTYTFYDFVITDRDKELLNHGFNGQFDNKKWVKNYYTFVCKIIDFLDRMNKINDTRYILAGNKLNFRITEKDIDEVKSMENLMTVLKHIEENNLYSNRLLKAILKVQEFQILFANELQINLKDLGFLGTIY